MPNIDYWIDNITKWEKIYLDVLKEEWESYENSDSQNRTKSPVSCILERYEQIYASSELQQKVNKFYYEDIESLTPVVEKLSESLTIGLSDLENIFYLGNRLVTFFDLNHTKGLRSHKSAIYCMKRLLFWHYKSTSDKVNFVWRKLIDSILDNDLVEDIQFKVKYIDSEGYYKLAFISDASKKNVPISDIIKNILANYKYVHPNTNYVLMIMCFIFERLGIQKSRCLSLHEVDSTILKRSILQYTTIKWGERDLLKQLFASSADIDERFLLVPNFDKVDISQKIFLDEYMNDYLIFNYQRQVISEISSLDDDCIKKLHKIVISSFFSSRSDKLNLIVNL